MPTAGPTRGRAGAPVVAPAWQAQFVLLAAIWGSSFLCIKVLGERWPPVDVALGRIALGAVTLLALVAARGDRLPRDRATWRHLAVVGLLMSVKGPGVHEQPDDGEVPPVARSRGRRPPRAATSASSVHGADAT